MTTAAHSVKHAKPDHPVLAAIAQRYSPYAFDPRPVEREKLLSCLEAARWAASSFNEQPWSYILTVREDQTAFKTMLGCLVEANQAWAKYAGVLIITTVKRRFAKNNNPNRVCEHDVGLAAGNLTLQAQTLGLHVHRMAGIDIQKCRQTYAIPDGHDPMTGIAIGYAADPARFDNAELAKRDQSPRGRRPLREWVFGVKFGQTSSLV